MKHFGKFRKDFIFCSFTFFSTIIFFTLYILPGRDYIIMADAGSYDVASLTRHENYIRSPREKETERSYLWELNVHAGCGRRTLALLNFLPSPCLALILLTFLFYLLDLLSPLVHRQSSLLPGPRIHTG